MDELNHFGIFICMKTYIFYKTINTKNGKYYYGSHSGISNDGYLGSGLALGEAIVKYGKDSFIRYDLKIFETAIDMYRFEDRFLKLYNLAADKNCYNLKNAARGGNTIVNYTEEEIIEEYKKRAIKIKKSLKVYFDNNPKEPLTEETKKKISNSIKCYIEQNGIIPITDETRCKMSNKKLGANHWIYGKKRDESVKEKIRNTLKGIKHDDTRKLNMKISNQNREIITCPHCGKSGKKHRNMTVYHFDNCKLKNTEK